MINNYVGVGNITKELELKVGQSGKKFISFTIAINKGNDSADFIPCVAYEKQAEIIAQYCAKGSAIGIIGRLQSRTYEANNGEKRFVLEVVVINVELLGKKIDKPIEATKKVETKIVEDDLDSELPF